MFGSILLAASVALTATVTPWAATPDVRAGEVLVETEPVTLPWLLASANIPEARCPAHAPTLLGEPFSHGGATGYVSLGVELRIKGGPGVDANVLRFTRDGTGGAGGWDSSVTNWSPGKKTVQMVLHCG